MLWESQDCNFPTKWREKKSWTLCLLPVLKPGLSCCPLYLLLCTQRQRDGPGWTGGTKIHTQCHQLGSEMPTCHHLPKPLTSLCATGSSLFFQNLGNLVEIKINSTHFLTSKSRKILCFISWQKMLCQIIIVCISSKLVLWKEVAHVAEGWWRLPVSLLLEESGECVSPHLASSILPCSPHTLLATADSFQI